MINQSTDLANIKVRGFYYKDHFDHLAQGMAASAVSKPNTGITPANTYCLTWVKQDNKAFGFVSIATGKDLTGDIFTGWPSDHIISQAMPISKIVELPVDMVTYPSQSLPNTMVADAIAYVLINS